MIKNKIKNICPKDEHVHGVRVTTQKSERQLPINTPMLKRDMKGAPELQRMRVVVVMATDSTMATAPEMTKRNAEEGR